ncbi:MAG: hypothetical protein ACOVOQ_04595 [Flavobacterium sp.]
MIKNNTRHLALKNRLACKKLSNLIDQNPEVFRVKITPNIVANDRQTYLQNVSIAGVLLAFFVKVFH